MKGFVASGLCTVFSLASLDAFALSDPSFHNYTTTTTISASGPAVPGTTITLNATVQAQSGGAIAVRRLNPDLSQNLIGGTVKFFNGATQIGSVQVTPTNTNTGSPLLYTDQICIGLGLPATACTFYYYSAPSTHLTSTFAVPINATGTLTFSAQFSGDMTFSTRSTSTTLTAPIPGGAITISPRFDVVPTSATTANVLVPSTQTSGSFAYAWNAPGYGTIDLQGRINGGAWLTPLQIPATGNNGDNLPLGSTYTFRILPHGGNTVLGQIAFTAIAAPAPTFTMTPTHVIVPLGQTSGPFNYSWSAPGYETLDLQGRINGGAWLAPLEVQSTYSTGDNLAVGSTYEFRFLPHGDTTHVLGTISVTASH
ncbi:MAG: hypothetical protein ABIR62_14275 [Dokdonella sp.]|uniref:hypothetical protein n=1 Tax=Dokdonella sp. TaxID=2291710 RepID=UPI0032677D10